MSLFQTLLFEAKKLFNEYSHMKDLYSTSPIPDNETRLKDSLAPFLLKVIDVCRELESKTESRVERDLLKQFADELKNVFK